METRIQAIEKDVASLNTAVTIMGAKMDKLGDNLTALSNRLEANKPLSFQTVLTTAISTAVFVSMIVGAIFFLVDARVGSATTRANAFVDEMTTDGRLYVQMQRFADRLERVESAIRWTPSIVALADDKRR